MGLFGNAWIFRPELHDAIIERWGNDPMFREQLRKPIGNFLASDYELWNDADDWDLDADSIEAIYEVLEQHDQLDKFAVFQHQRDRLSTALARYYRCSLRHSEHEILQEKAQAAERDNTAEAVIITKSSNSNDLVAEFEKPQSQCAPLLTTTQVTYIASPKEGDGNVDLAAMISDLRPQLAAMEKLGPQLAALHLAIEEARATPEISDTLQNSNKNK